MKKSTILRFSLAVAMLFTISINADAQLGKLKGLADKAKKTVSQDADQSASEKRVMDDYVKSSPREQEKRAAEAAGGMDKYLGLDKTENGRILWKYASMEPAEYRKTMQIHNAFDAANQVVQVLRYVKGNTETFEMYHQQSVVLNVFNTRIPNNLQAAAKASKNGAAVSAKDIAAIKSEAARVKKMYMESSGAPVRRRPRLTMPTCRTLSIRTTSSTILPIRIARPRLWPTIRLRSMPRSSSSWPPPRSSAPIPPLSLG